MKKVIALLLFLLSPTLHAATKYSISCGECGAQLTMVDGPNKMQAIKSLAHQKVFFCEKTKKFVQLKAQPALKKANRTLATPTRTQLEPGEFKWTFNSCKNALIPLDYYIRHPELPCPICGKGPLKIDAIGFYD